MPDPTEDLVSIPVHQARLYLYTIIPDLSGEVIGKIFELLYELETHEQSAAVGVEEGKS